ncbi:Conidial yellow pigment biosynthesis polyketide synthase [Daldinia childiae]|uniref:Conidial yellow pigment biosynthesis polyketide synthase n=1 Tax=Daldinia childiae TaxID=326645 RepID=UPI0014470990|nr:Conidial yellow pigment biosynthesis polyketide synthase [Daldinia childiae]KAF3064674.1 Conidial yellow pigment biosynthesis polyketide synthase [Daldinia childiae]
MYAAAANSAANTLLLFGPQIPRLVPSRLTDLRKTILEDPSLGFLVHIVRELPSLWETTIQPSSSNFRRLARAKQQLEQLGTFFENQNEEAPRFGSPSNLLLAPLTAISQIVEYLRLGHKGTVQGFCVGFLAATAVASARDKDDLEKWTATAIRLAVCIGAVIDLDELERSDEGGDSSRSSSTWVTLTIPEGQFTSFARQLADGGLSAKPVGLSGRYHTTSPDRTEIVQQLKLLFQHNEHFQFPAAERLTVPLRSTLDTEIITKGALQEIALDCILVGVCRWYETVQATLDAWDGQPVKIIPIGSSPGAVPRSLKLATDTPTNGYFDQSLLPETSSPSSGITTGNLATGQTTPSGSLPPTAVGTAQPIAVIGMACRYAQSDSLEDFWSLINSGRNATTPVPENRFKSSDLWRNPKGPFFGNFLREADAFDHRFFGMSAREAASMDPQQRLLLQVSYEAMESAGYADGSESPHRPVGCYIGAGYVEYEDNIASEDATAFSATGAIRAFISGRVSHYFGWTGPSVVFDTACSSSAVAIHHACKALQTNDCSVAIAGGVNVITSSTFYQNLAAASFLNTTGASRAFDAQANGYCRGEGAGVLVLKPLAQAIADNDHILGTITGTAVNQNSSCSPITVPDSQSQSDLYLQALAGGGVLPSEVSYVEAHGTGTPVGDPIECASIRSAFGSPNRTQELVIGSVKDVIGHTEAASGVAGVIKTLLMMQYGIIPKQPNFTRLNPKIPALEPDKMAIASQARPWHTSTRRAALINNYGAAGSNAAIVVREYRRSSAAEDVINQLPEDNKIEYPIFISAKTAESVRAYSAALKSFLDRNPSIQLSDVAYNLARKQNRMLEYASTWTTASLSALRKDLEAIASSSRPVLQRSIDRKKKTAATQWPAPVVLCFGGQTGRSIYLSRDLVQNTPFLRAHLESCNEVCQSLGLSSFFPRIFDPTPVDDLVFLHAMLFSVQYSSAQAWLDAGLKISTLIGHSFGQLTALVVAGSLDLTDGLRLVTGRARLMEKLWGADAGVMLAIEGDTERLDYLLKTVAEKQSVDVACYNGPRNIVLASDTAAADAAEKICRETPGLKTVRLANSHAYHSRLADPILDDLQALASTLTWRKPSIRLETCSPNQSWTSIDAAKIASHTREPVYFGEAIQRIANQNPSSVWLEAGSVSPIIGMVAGIHANCLQEGGGDDDVSVCNAIGEVLWSESLLQSVSQDTSSKNRTWRVYSNMEAKGKNTLVNDVFVLDPTTGSIVLAFLGAEFTQVSLTSLRRVLSKINGNTITPAPSKSTSLSSTTNNVFADTVQPQQPQVPFNNDITRHNDHSTTTTTKSETSVTPLAASGVNQSVRKMLSDIFGMSIEEVQPDADLADLGVDSLMITEISSEIQKHFGVTLSIDDLQDLTDVQSLIRILGGESSIPTPTSTHTPTPAVQSLNEVTHGHEEDDEEKEDSNDDGGIAAVANDWLCVYRNTFDEDAQKHDLIGFHKAVYPFQAQLVVAYTVEAFADLGCDIRTLRSGERLPDFKYLPKHEKLVAQMHKILEDASLITLKDGSSRAIRTDQPLLRNTGARLADCLAGRLDPLAVMFGDAEARKLMGDVYATAPLFRAATSFLSRFLSNVCERFQGKREIRILELGGGTGGTTKTLVDLFEKSDVKKRIVYTFSDVSRSLVAAAKRRFAQYPFMEYAVIDIEKEPPTDLQGRFDLIISTNCIHATSNLVRSCTNIRHLLREDGLLCLVENEENLFWYDLVWGLVEGWWLFEDDRTHALIPAARWKTKLQASGFQWVDWSTGSSEESKILRIIAASPSAQLLSPAVNSSNQELEIVPETQETVIFKHVGPLPLQADIYYPPTLQTGSDARPVALMVHGGGHVMLSRKDIRPKQTQILLDAGFVPISVDYRLCPETTLEEGPITDVCDALRWVRNTLPSLARKRSDVRINGDRVVAVGWSTGGTLALSLGWSAPSTGLQPPQAILAFYCPTDYEDKSWSRENKPYGDAVMTETYNLLDGVEDSPITAYNPPTGSRAAGGWMAKNDARSRIVLHMNWHGQTVPVLVHGLKKKKNAQQNGTPQLPTPTPSQVQAISPLAHIRNGSYRTPTFLVHPYEDDLIPWQQAQRTADELCSRGIDSELRLISNAAHLFDMYRSHEGNEEAVRAINDGYAFLSRHVSGA